VKPSLLLQALVPAPLELAHDKPVVGIDGVILLWSVRVASKRACSSASSNFEIDELVARVNELVVIF
jgi:hypothetical protein